MAKKHNAQTAILSLSLSRPRKEKPMSSKAIEKLSCEANQNKPGAAKPRTGTREWAKDTVNIQLGCEHGCRYCYARWMMVDWLRKCTAEQWLNPTIDNKAVDSEYKKIAGVIMFPSTHDITQRNLSECLCVLRKLLDADNKVLIVSKPHWNCITLICETLQAYRQQIMFRFTIGSMSDEILRFWEPAAPGFEERQACLEYAWKGGYQTSVSCEPYLDTNTTELLAAVGPYITDSPSDGSLWRAGFWIGKLREFNRRVDLTAITPEQMDKYVNPLKAACSDEAVRALYNQLEGFRFVKWKDSIRKVIEK